MNEMLLEIGVDRLCMAYADTGKCDKNSDGDCRMCIFDTTENLLEALGEHVG